MNLSRTWDLASLGRIIQNVAANVANVAAPCCGRIAGVAEPVYAADLKSAALTKACGFESRLQHQNT